MPLEVKHDWSPWTAPIYPLPCRNDHVLHLHDHWECTCIKPPYHQHSALSQPSCSHVSHVDGYHQNHVPITTKWYSVLISSRKYASTPTPSSLILITKQNSASFGPHQPSRHLPPRSWTNNKMSLACFLVQAYILIMPCWTKGNLEYVHMWPQNQYKLALSLRTNVLYGETSKLINVQRVLDALS